MKQCKAVWRYRFLPQSMADADREIHFASQLGVKRRDQINQNGSI